MAKSAEKISIRKFETLLPEDNIEYITLDGTEEITVAIKKTLGLTEMLSFVREVVETCVDGETGEYVPEAFDFAIRINVLTRYANFTMPASLDKQYALIYSTGVFETVMEHINAAQFNDIIRAINKKIDFMLDVISASAVSKIHEVIGRFNQIAETTENTFGNIDPESVATVVSNIKKFNNIDEATIAKAILEARSEEDRNG